MSSLLLLAAVLLTIAALVAALSGKVRRANGRRTRAESGYLATEQLEARALLSGGPLVLEQSLDSAQWFTGEPDITLSSTPALALTGADDASQLQFQLYDRDAGRHLHTEFVAGNRFQIDDPLAAGNYVAYARVEDAGGVGPWEILNFTVAGSEWTPAAPMLTGPSGDVNARTPRVDWTRVVGAASYEVLAYNATRGRLLEQTETATTSFTFSDPLAEGDATVVYVRSVSPHGTPGAWASLRFDPLVPHAAPQFTGVSGDVDAGRPTSNFTQPASGDAELLIYNKAEGRQHLHLTGLVGSAFTPAVPWDAGVYQAFVRGEGTTWSKLEFTLQARPGWSPPVLTLPEQVSLLEGEDLNLVIPINDPGSSGWRIHADYGNGTQPETWYTTDPRLELSQHYPVGQHTMQLEITDESGGVTTATVRVVVENLPPAVTGWTLPESAVEGETVQFAATATDPGGVEPDYFWEFADGTTASGRSVAVVFNDDGELTFTLTVIDAHGAETSRNGAVTVVNQAPDAALPEFLKVAQGEALQFEGSIVDSGANTHRVWVDYEGDGEFHEIPVDGNGVFHAEHIYRTPGEYDLTAVIEDDKRARVEKTVKVHVANLPPTFTNLTIPDTAVEGQAVRLTAEIEDAGDVANVEWIVNGQRLIGNGVDYVFADDGEHLVQAIARDADGAETVVESTIVVVNGGPVIDIATTADAVERRPFELPGTITDPGVNDKLEAAVDYGDGVWHVLPVEADGSITLHHTYERVGQHFIRIVALDNGYAVASETVVVSVLPPEAKLLELLQSESVEQELAENETDRVRSVMDLVPLVDATELLDEVAPLVSLDADPADRTPTFERRVAAGRKLIEALRETRGALEAEIDAQRTRIDAAHAAEAAANEIQRRYLQQIGDPSQAVTPELHVRASRFRWEFHVDYRDMPDAGYRLRFAGDTEYALNGRDGTVEITGLPRPVIHIDYPLELIDGDGRVIEHIRQVKVIGGRVGRTGAINETFRLPQFTHVPQLPPELHVSKQQRADAESATVGAANARQDAGERIAILEQEIAALNRLMDEIAGRLVPYTRLFVSAVNEPGQHPELHIKVASAEREVVVEASAMRFSQTIRFEPGETEREVFISANPDSFVRNTGVPIIVRTPDGRTLARYDAYYVRVGTPQIMFETNNPQQPWEAYDTGLLIDEPLQPSVKVLQTIGPNVQVVVISPWDRNSIAIEAQQPVSIGRAEVDGEGGVEGVAVWLTIDSRSNELHRGIVLRGGPAGQPIAGLTLQWDPAAKQLTPISAAAWFGDEFEDIVAESAATTAIERAQQLGRDFTISYPKLREHEQYRLYQDTVDRLPGVFPSEREAEQIFTRTAQRNPGGYDGNDFHRSFDWYKLIAGTLMKEALGVVTEWYRGGDINAAMASFDVEYQKVVQYRYLNEIAADFGIRIPPQDRIQQAAFALASDLLGTQMGVRQTATEWMIKESIRANRKGPKGPISREAWERNAAIVRNAHGEDSPQYAAFTQKWGDRPGVEDDQTVVDEVFANYEDVASDLNPLHSSSNESTETELSEADRFAANVAARRLARMRTLTLAQRVIARRNDRLLEQSGGDASLETLDRGNSSGGSIVAIEAEALRRMQRRLEIEKHSFLAEVAGDLHDSGWDGEALERTMDDLAAAMTPAPARIVDLGAVSTPTQNQNNLVAMLSSIDATQADLTAVHDAAETGAVEFSNANADLANLFAMPGAHGSGPQHDLFAPVDEPSAWDWLAQQATLNVIGQSVSEFAGEFAGVIFDASTAMRRQAEIHNNIDQAASLGIIDPSAAWWHKQVATVALGTQVGIKAFVSATAGAWAAAKCGPAAHACSIGAAATTATAIEAFYGGVEQVAGALIDNLWTADPAMPETGPGTTLLDSAPESQLDGENALELDEP